MQQLGGNFVPNETRSPATLPGTVYVRVTGDGLIDQIYEVNFAESEAVKPAGDGEYVLASSIEAGKTYVVVADEAYALTSRSENDFGFEAVDTLLKNMEDHTERTVPLDEGFFHAFFEAYVENDQSRLLNQLDSMK